MDYTVHSSTIVDDAAEIGARTRIWHWVHACAGEKIGDKQLCCPGCTPQATAVSRRVMSLPMSADLDMEDQQHIVNTLAANQNSS